MQKPSAKLRIPEPIWISSECKEGKDRGNSNKLKDPVKQDQAHHGKELESTVGKSQSVAANEKTEKRFKHDAGARGVRSSVEGFYLRD